MWLSMSGSGGVSGLTTIDDVAQTALFLAAHRSVAVADGLVRWQPEGPLDFVPDMLMYDPERTKQGLMEAYRRVLDLDWDTLLLAHGRPLVGADGRREMARVVAAQGA